ncbi:MAG: hypothetical protein OSJ45_06510 [Lachnospiraceae bacterium]|nr:hypothetical protein [Lachnospiraceae bacterium]
MDLVAYEIKIPYEMKTFLEKPDKKTELQINAMLLYPYIHNLSISHGRAAEILGINKYDLINLYEDLGLPYYSMDFSEVEEDIKTFHELENNLV